MTTWSGAPQGPPLCCRRKFGDRPAGIWGQLLPREPLQGHCGEVRAQVCVPRGTNPDRGLPRPPPCHPSAWGNCQLTHVTRVSPFMLGE